MLKWNKQISSVAECYLVTLQRDTKTGVVFAECWERECNPTHNVTGLNLQLERRVQRDRETGAVIEEAFGREDGLRTTVQYGACGVLYRVALRPKKATAGRRHPRAKATPS